MDNENINRIAFSLVEKMIHRKKFRGGSELHGSEKEQIRHDWSDKFVDMGPLVARMMEGDETFGIMLERSDYETGFISQEYKDFEKLVSEIGNLPDYENKVSKTTIESESFRWFIEVHSEKRAKLNILDYLTTQFPTEHPQYEFYFPVINLVIPKPFVVGDTHFTFFTKESMDELYQKYKNTEKGMPEEEFEEIFRSKYQGKVLVKVVVQSERDMAENIARKKAELATDIVKIFGLTANTVDDIKIFDLHYKVNMPEKTEFLTKEKGDIGFGINVNFENRYLFKLPIEIIEGKKKYAFDILSDFIKIDPADEWCRFINNGIKIFSSALSVPDLHLRSIPLITFVESLLLKDDEKWGASKLVKERISILLMEDADKRKEIVDLFEYMYGVRNDMAHKAIKKDILIESYDKVQRCLIILLIRIVDIYNKRQIRDKNAFIDMVVKGDVH